MFPSLSLLSLQEPHCLLSSAAPKGSDVLTLRSLRAAEGLFSPSESCLSVCPCTGTRALLLGRAQGRDTTASQLFFFLNVSFQTCEIFIIKSVSSSLLLKSVVYLPHLFQEIVPFNKDIEFMGSKSGLFKVLWSHGPFKESMCFMDPLPGKIQRKCTHSWVYVLLLRICDLFLKLKILCPWSTHLYNASNGNYTTRILRTKRPLMTDNICVLLIYVYVLYIKY